MMGRGVLEMMFSAKLGEPGREQAINLDNRLKPAKSVPERARGFKSHPRRHVKSQVQFGLSWLRWFRSWRLVSGTTMVFLKRRLASVRLYV